MRPTDGVRSPLAAHGPLLRIAHVRQLDRLRQLWVHAIPGLGTRGVDVLAGPECTRVVQTARSNRDHLGRRAGEPEQGRSAVAAKRPRCGVSAICGELEVFRTSLGYHK